MSRANLTHNISLITGYEPIALDLFRRLLLVVLLILFITMILWADRDGLVDTTRPEEQITFLDVFYYTVVSIQTVGYGDIVPITPRARLISTLVVTPVRVFILVIFIGTAYQLVLQRYREAYRMRRIQEKLNNHIIICGYGVKGHATVDQLVSLGRKRDEIAVIDINPDSAEDAAKDGLIAFRGDAASEAALNAAGVKTAEVVVVDVDRDDSAVLICLTAKHLNSDVCVVAAGKEAENVPLIYRSGADVVVASPVAGGRMLAMATVLGYVPRFMDDILTFGKGLDFGEKRIESDEAGLTLDQLSGLADKLPIGAYHQGKRFSFAQLEDMRFDSGDVIIYLVSKPEETLEA